MKALIASLFLVSSSAFGALDPGTASELKAACTGQLTAGGASRVGSKVFCECLVDAATPHVEATNSSIEAWLHGAAGQEAATNCHDKALEAESSSRGKGNGGVRK